MIRRPDSIKKGDTIGVVAPSFGAATEPYSVLIDIAEDKIKERGYKIKEGKTARLGDGIGISTDPEVAAADLVDFYLRDDIDAIISAGGGELMNETISHVDFKKLKAAKPKWYLGYSDNTNFIFPMVTIADTMGIYGPCINGYGKLWEETEYDAFALLEGTRNKFKGYDMFELREKVEIPEGEEAPSVDYSKLYQYNYNQKKILRTYDCSTKKARMAAEDEEVSMKGILLGGCLDVLFNLVGTRFDNMKAFNKEHKDIIWVLEACDLNPMAYRRAVWGLKEAGWFENSKGFIIGRPLVSWGQDMMGADQYNAVTAVVEELGVPIIMDADIGHINPMLPIVMGAKALVTAKGNDFDLEYSFD